MQVFLSWSGDYSGEVAGIFREWLPSVIQAIRPYMSTEDTEKGARWTENLSSELSTASFGILFVTAENIDSAWLNFEAGALSKSIDVTKVCPFLVNIKNSEVKGPLVQFQTTLNEKEDIRKLIRTINKASGDLALDETRLDRSFETWWPTLLERLTIVDSKYKSANRQTSAVSKGPTSEIAQNEILEELLILTREHQKILTSPERLLPIDYVEYVVGESRRNQHISPMAIADLRSIYDEILAHFEVDSEEMFSAAEIQSVIKKLSGVIDYMTDRNRARRPSAKRT